MYASFNISFALDPLHPPFEDNTLFSMDGTSNETSLLALYLKSTVIWTSDGNQWYLHYSCNFIYITML